MLPNVSMPEASIPGAVAVRRRGRWVRRAAWWAFVLVWGATAYWQTHKSLPPGTQLATPWYLQSPGSLRLLSDVTTTDAYGHPVLNQAIFDRMLALVRGAREFIVLDYFLFNDSSTAEQGSALPLRPLASELRDALIERRREVPGLKVLFITDPINDSYGALPSNELAALRAAGIEVAVTDLDRMRDSNFLYSSLWRLGVRWWDGAAGSGWLPDPLGSQSPPWTLGAWTRLLNFKADHRKVLIADDGRGGLTGIIASANPHGPSSAHSNLGVELSGAVLEPLLASELAIARFSGWQGELQRPPAPASSSASTAADPPGAPPGAPPTAAPTAGAQPGAQPGALQPVRVRVLTEGAIREALIEQLEGAGRGDAIDIATFYLSERGVIEALIGAARRGATVRLILDPNREAFGRERNGIPNRPAASELVAASDGAIRVRWYRTHGEQFHVKLAMVYGTDRLWATLGSANFTRRNLDDYNLEANLALEAARDSPLAQQMLEYFETLWSNRAPPGTEYTAEVGVYADASQLHYWAYRIMEATGLSTF